MKNKEANFYLLKNRKKAEISSSMLVTIILLIVGFVIVLLIYKSFDFSSLSDKEVCHTSVILRGSTPGTLIPLNCKTEKICVRGKKLLSKGECEEFKNEKKVRYVDVSTLEEVEKLIADEVVDCWSTLGEGKLSLFPSGFKSEFGLGGVYSSCVICSRIAFDKETLSKKNIDVSKRDVLNYMKTHKIPNRNESYYNFLLKERANVKLTPPSEDSKNLGVVDESKEGIKENINLEDIVERINGEEEIAILFMEISAPPTSKVLTNYFSAIAGAGTFAYVTGGSKLTKPTVKLIGRVCSLPYGKIACGAAVMLGVSYVTKNVITNQGIAATHCGDVVVGDEVRKGCNIIRTVNYDVEALREYCGVIESIP